MWKGYRCQQKVYKKGYTFSVKRWYIKGQGLDLAAQPHRDFVEHTLPSQGFSSSSVFYLEFLFRIVLILFFYEFQLSKKQIRFLCQTTKPYHQTRPSSSCTVSFKLPQHKFQTGCLWAIFPSRLGPWLWAGSREVNVIKLWMNLTKHTLKYTHLRLEVSGLLFSALLNCS